MKLGTRAAVVVSGLLLAVSPAALASGSPGNSGEPGPGASPSAKAKAYGRYCQDQSKKHVAGQKGTPFSQCVTAMAKLASGATPSATAACAGMSKQHVAGQKGTPFGNCVAAAAKLKNDQKKGH